MNAYRVRLEDASGNVSVYSNQVSGTPTTVVALLDSYKTGVAVAYAFHLLFGDYAGPGLQAYRVSDAATLDIDFDTGTADNPLDTAALTTFAVRRRGAAADALRPERETAATSSRRTRRRCPGSPTRAGTSSRTRTATSRRRGSARRSCRRTFTLAQPTHRFIVSEGDIDCAIGDGGSATTGVVRYNSVPAQLRVIAGTTFNTPNFPPSSLRDTPRLIEVLLNGAASKVGVDDFGTFTGDAGTTAPDGVTLFASGGDGANLEGHIAVWLGYASDKSADAAAIRAALNGLYSVY